MITGLDDPVWRGPPAGSGAESWLRRIIGGAALVSVVSLVVLSWLPQGAMARTGAPGLFEHICAYAGASFLSALAVEGPRRRWLGLAFVILGAVLEAGQIWIPGRTAQVSDLAASVSGAILGIALVCGPGSSLLGRDPARRGGKAEQIVPVSLILLGFAVTPVWIGFLGWLAFRGLSALVN